MQPKASPAIEVRNAQRAIAFSRDKLQTFAEIEISLAWQKRRTRSEMAAVDTIALSIVSDRRIAQLHEQFCGVAGATDVLTFQHGEIAISAETAARNARIFHTSTEHELRLYIVHGLLHLCGYDDTTPRARSTMGRLQRALLREAVRRERMCSFERTSAHVNLHHGPAASRGRSNERANHQSRRRNSRHRKGRGDAIRN